MNLMNWSTCFYIISKVLTPQFCQIYLKTILAKAVNNETIVIILCGGNTNICIVETTPISLVKTYMHHKSPYSLLALIQVTAGK